MNFNDLCSNVLPDGTYKVMINDIKIKRSTKNENGNDLQVNYTITEGPLAKRTLIDTIYEKSFSFRLKPFLEACGIDTAREFASTKELFDYGINNAKGKIIMIELGSRVYNGVKYNDIKGFSALPGSTTSADEVADLVSKFNFGKVEMKENKEPEVKIIDPNPQDVIKEPKVDFNLDDNNDDDEVFY